MFLGRCAVGEVSDPVTLPRIAKEGNGSGFNSSLTFLQEREAAQRRQVMSAQCGFLLTRFAAAGNLAVGGECCPARFPQRVG